MRVHCPGADITKCVHLRQEPALRSFSHSTCTPKVRVHCPGARADQTKSEQPSVDLTNQMGQLLPRDDPFRAGRPSAGWLITAQRGGSRDACATTVCEMTIAKTRPPLAMLIITHDGRCWARSLRCITGACHRPEQRSPSQHSLA